MICCNVGVDGQKFWKVKPAIAQCDRHGTPENRRLITARAVTAPGQFYAHGFVIGDEEGVAAGDPVITSNGLVGLVFEVGRAYARVLMISDINARIPVMLASSSWPGLTMGRNSDYLELAFLPVEAQPAIGELVLTSGHGGILPAGLAVGRVERVMVIMCRCARLLIFAILAMYLF